MSQTAPRRPRLALALMALGLALALPLTAVLAARFHVGLAEPAVTAGDPAPRVPALTVQVLSVAHETGFNRQRYYTGRVEPYRQGDLGFERGGLLGEVLVREGDPVEAGQVLARLDKALLRAQRTELEAALGSAQANLALAEATLKRYQGSVDQGAVTRQALDEAREGARAAAAGLGLARARLASLDLEIAKTELKAPYPGVVIRRGADEGRVLAAGEPVLRLQEDRVPEIRIGVAGPLADTLSPGTEYRLTWRGQPLVARLRALLPLRAAGARTLDALFEPMDPAQAPPAALRPGEQVQLELAQWVEEPGVWLPLGALTEGSRGLWSAYALEPSSGSDLETADLARLVPRPLEVLYQEGDRVFVRGPLAAGERLVAAGLHRVVPGQLVRALDAPEVERARRVASRHGISVGRLPR